MYVFSYGSLLDPESLRRTLPEVDPAACVPAVCRDYVRSFSVAFPNDGSQTDKAYFDPRGDRPAVVLFCDIRPAPRQRVNGICVPLDDIALETLRRRELRYDLADVTELTSPYPATRRGLPGRVVTFIGKERFTRPDDVRRAWCPSTTWRPSRGERRTGISAIPASPATTGQRRWPPNLAALCHSRA